MINDLARRSSPGPCLRIDLLDLFDRTRNTTKILLVRARPRTRGSDATMPRAHESIRRNAGTEAGNIGGIGSDTRRRENRLPVVHTHTHTREQEKIVKTRDRHRLFVYAPPRLSFDIVCARALHLHEEKRTTIELSIRDMIVMFVCCWVRRFSKAHLCHCRVLTPIWRYD